MGVTSSSDKLVRMANQIATFFRSYPDDEAVAGIQKHIVAFWTPKMRQTLENYASTAGDQLDTLVVAALTTKVQAESPIRAATRDPHLIGAGASDAG